MTERHNPETDFVFLGRWYGVDRYAALEDGRHWGECACGGTLLADERRGGLVCNVMYCHVEIVWDEEELEALKAEWAERIAKRDARKPKKVSA